LDEMVGQPGIAEALPVVEVLELASVDDWAL
jgi:hypothetical protein